MFKHIAINSKCSENSGSYQKPGLENLEHWKALTLAQHQPCCNVSNTEQLEISAAYRCTTEIPREAPKETYSNQTRANLKNLLQSLKLKFSSLPQTIRRTP